MVSILFSHIFFAFSHQLNVECQSATCGCCPVSSLHDVGHPHKSVKLSLVLFLGIYLFIYLIDDLRRTWEYFTYRTAVSGGSDHLLTLSESCPEKIDYCWNWVSMVLETELEWKPEVPRLIWPEPDGSEKGDKPWISLWAFCIKPAGRVKSHGAQEKQISAVMRGLMTVEPLPYWLRAFCREANLFIDISGEITGYLPFVCIISYVLRAEFML